MTEAVAVRNFRVEFRSAKATHLNSAWCFSAFIILPQYYPGLSRPPSDSRRPPLYYPGYAPGRGTGLPARPPPPRNSVVSPGAPFQKAFMPSSAMILRAASNTPVYVV